MLTDKKRVSASELNDGDIFFVDLDHTEMDNEHLVGADATTGNVVCLVADDTGDFSEGQIYVNGGQIIYLSEDDYVLVIGHYKEIVPDFPDSFHG